jgi:alpha-D-xyloside xylohydrolase
LHAQGFFEGLREVGEGPVLSLCRSAWAGSQRWGVALWSGDVESSFAALAAQVPAGMNAGISGIPWWTSDIGGFYGGHLDSPSFRELVVRWSQFGLFCPLFRLHGSRDPGVHDGPNRTGAANEVWSFGDEVYEIFSEQLRLREALRAYLMAQMANASATGVPPMRPLFLDFPDDTTSWEVDDQFLLGPDVLVAPVTAEGVRERAVYLPAGSAWTSAWTGERAEGGTWLQCPAPLERIPVFLRDGGALPAGAMSKVSAP